VRTTRPRGAARLSFYNKRMDRLERGLPQRGSVLGMGCVSTTAMRWRWRGEGVAGRRRRLRAGARRPCAAGAARGRFRRGWDRQASPDGGSTRSAVTVLSTCPIRGRRCGICRALLRRGGALMLEVPNQFRSLKDSVRGLVVNVLGAGRRAFWSAPRAPTFICTTSTPAPSGGYWQARASRWSSCARICLGTPCIASTVVCDWVQEATYAVDNPLEEGR